MNTLPPNPVFLEKANTRRVRTRKWLVRPVGQVKFVRDPAAWQGLRPEALRTAKPLSRRPLKRGARFILDFGEEYVGRLKLTLRSETNHNDSPVQLRIIFAEFPLEITNRRKKVKSFLEAAWMQDEIVKLDDMPQCYTIERPAAMRYTYIEVLHTPNRLVFEDIVFEACSAVRDFVPVPEHFTPEEKALDLASQRTLRNCMQGVLLDGPKRDRRLWLGDLRLEAQVNAVTFRSFDIIERSLYLLASCLYEDGRIGACVFDRPFVYHGQDYITDYAFLLADALWFHYEQTGNREILEDLYPVAARQFEIWRPFYGKTGICREGLPAWNFIDWCEPLDRATAVEGCYIFGLRKLVRMARLLGKRGDVKRFEAEIAFLCNALRKENFDQKRGLFESGEKRQFSWASQIWMILAEVVCGEEARRLLKKAEASPDLVKPVTPYLHHHLLEAFRMAGETEKMKRHLHAYWGEMLRQGMTVYPEVFVPEQPFLSPYGPDPRINSACHAWSCAPAYFLR